MKQLKLCILSFFLTLSLHSFAQNDSIPFFKGAIKENREKLYRNLVNNTITKNLSLPLSEETEENWESAFWTMEVLQYQSPWVNGKIYNAFDSIEKRTTEFQRALLELVYGSYPKEHSLAITRLLKITTNEKVFAMCAAYLMQAEPSDNMKKFIGQQLREKKEFGTSDKGKNIIIALKQKLQKPKKGAIQKVLPILLSDQFLANNVIVYSFQRKNRNYPGIAIIRDSVGNFIKDSNENIIAIPQLARSASALPFYLTNGNTPQGIFRMYGLDTSKSSFIGPTANIQLTMPYETSLQHFLNDSTITDSIWTIDWYKKLLPKNIQNYLPLYETYYASAAGRTEIIAHGTTVNPEYYKNKPYYPQTPTQGCLATKEIWSDVDGKRLESDQQKLVDAVKQAGSARGYYVVIELDDKEEAVSIEEVLAASPSLPLQKRGRLN